MKTRILFFCGVLAALLATLASKPAAAITEEQAVKIARDFCAAIGEPVTAPAVATPG